MGDNSIPNNSYTEIETIIADSTETFTSYSLSYLYGSNADYGIDVLDTDLSNPLTHSQDDAVRGVYYDSGLYRTIASSSFFGAMADGINNNTKADVMAQFISFLIGDPAPNIVASADQIDFGIIAPNYIQTFELEITNQGYETLSISDIVISGEGFGYNGVLQFDLDHLQLQILEIEFEADELGQFSGELSIISNDPDTPELLIPLTAECFTEAEDNLILETSKLIGNYPNPFNPTTTILFELNTEDTDDTELMIYNLRGQKIKTLTVTLSGVEGSAIWNGTDDNNQSVSSGIYFYKLKSGNYEQTKKMILMK
ncbi:MAG: T9SS type A sorting domain-containing protein [Candidatus Cloacimonadota bacterium]|nr:T9SS type A sorting domain-containing protein [Candidatus Cloacimonadota bacterium]